MSDGNSSGAPTIGVDSLAASAGAMLRAAREKRGVHIAALAAAIKVPQRKLEALEADRYADLVDMTFTRALAQTVCRTLKIDAQPVLERLPQAAGSPKLAHVATGLNAPFRDRPGRDEPADLSWLRRPVFWGTLLVLIAAGVLALLPDQWLQRVLRGRSTPVPAAASAATPAVTAPAASAIVVQDPPAMIATEAASAALPPLPWISPSTTPAAGAALILKSSSESWVDVQDANGQTLLSRRLAAGESASVDGAMPLRLTIGNAAATQVIFRGKPVDLSLNIRDNVARIQLN